MDSVTCKLTKCAVTMYASDSEEDYDETDDDEPKFALNNKGNLKSSTVSSGSNDIVSRSIPNESKNDSSTLTLNGSKTDSNTLTLNDSKTDSRSLNRRQRRALQRQETLLLTKHQNLNSKNTDKGVVLESGEKVLEVETFLTAMQALSGEDRQKWWESMERERAKILAHQTWVPLTHQEWAELDKTKTRIVPCALVLTQKRNGTYKSRCVALNNVAPSKQETPTFSPTVSQTALRFALTHAASRHHHLRFFDVENAFLQAILDQKQFGEIVVKIPSVWQNREENHSAYARLLRCLYGLDFAPRAWRLTLHKSLTSLGWVECETEQCLYKKPSEAVPGEFLVTTAYVDDCTVSGPDSDELDRELQAILKLHKGNEIQPKQIDSTTGAWDVLGADLEYSQSRGYMKLSMETYISKLVSQFNLSGHRPTYNPSYSEGNAAKGKPTNFPLKSLIGGLQWVATCARPDILQPLSVLSRLAGGENHTTGMVEAGKKILKYLSTTRTIGVTYSKENEQAFDNIFKTLLPKKGTKNNSNLPEWNLFTDASFGSCTRTLRSTSGTVLFYRSVPICWKSARQTIRAYSTCESEYVACADALAIEEQQGYMHFFTESAQPTPVWVDNQSAIAIAKSEDLNKKTKHFALRYMRVRDASSRIHFVPTHLQKADALTKSVPYPVRLMMFHHTSDVLDKAKALDQAQSESVPDDSYDMYFVFDCNFLEPWI